MSIIPVLAAAVLLAQQSDPQKKVDANQPVTLTGCVVRDLANGSSFTLTDSTDGAQYRLTGKSVSKYSGMAVQVVGVLDNRRVKIQGGLWPSPNVAGQAGAIDPGKAAVAALGGGTTGTGNVALPTLRITRVGLGAGECRK